MVDDIVVVGGGLTGLIVVRALNMLGVEPVLIEPDFVLGGLARGEIVNGFSVDAFPVFLSSKDIGRLEEIGLGASYHRVDYSPVTLKPGPLKEKMWGRPRGISVEKLDDPWPLRWSSPGYYPVEGWSKTLSTWGERLRYKHIHESFKKIVDRVALTYHGHRVEYKRLYYTLEVINAHRRLGVGALSFKPIYCHMAAISLIVEGGVPEWVLGFHGGTAILPHTIIFPSKLTRGFIEDHYGVSAMISYGEEGLRPGFLEQTISRLKKMNIVNGNIRMERVHIAKYACIRSGELDSYIDEIKNVLSEKKVVLVGRKALWKEMSIGELVSHIQDAIASTL